MPNLKAGPNTQQLHLLLETIASYSLTLQSMALDLNAQHSLAVGDAFHRVEMMATLIGTLADSAGAGINGDTADWCVGAGYRQAQTEATPSDSAQPASHSSRKAVAA